MSRMGVVLLLLASSMAHAQADNAVEAAKAQAAQLTEHLPAYACDLNGISETVRDGKARDRVPVTGTVNVRHTPAGEVTVHWLWNFHGGLFNLHPAKSFFMNKDFMEVATHLLRARQACYRFSMDGSSRLRFVSKDSAETSCSEEKGIHGLVDFNADGTVHHAELQHPDGNITSAAIDLVPVNLNGTVRMITGHYVAEHPADTGLQRFDVQYSNCHVFAAKVTLDAAEPAP